MMRLDRLAALVATVGPDGTSPVADAAAARWGLPAGTARYVRTSATSVYAAGGGYLRLLPAAERPLRDVRAVAGVGAALAAAGAPVASPRASRSARWVEVVPSAAGDLHVTYVEAASGPVEDPGKPGFERLGRTIGRLHRAGRTVERAGIPYWPDVVRDVVRRCGDGEVGAAIEPVLRRCVETLGAPDVLAEERATLRTTRKCSRGSGRRAGSQPRPTSRPRPSAVTPCCSRAVTTPSWFSARRIP